MMGMAVMSERTIGHGTWYDLMAKKVIGREKKLNRDMSRLRTEYGSEAFQVFPISVA